MLHLVYLLGRMETHPQTMRTNVRAPCQWVQFSPASADIQVGLRPELPEVLCGCDCDAHCGILARTCRRLTHVPSGNHATDRIVHAGAWRARACTGPHVACTYSY